MKFGKCLPPRSRQSILIALNTAAHPSWATAPLLPPGAPCFPVHDGRCPVRFATSFLPSAHLQICPSRCPLSALGSCLLLRSAASEGRAAAGAPLTYSRTTHRQAGSRRYGDYEYSCYGYVCFYFILRKHLLVELMALW